MERACRLYTRSGSCVSLSADGRSLVHAPAGTCDPNLLLLAGDTHLTLVDAREGRTRLAACSFEGVERGRAVTVAPAADMPLRATPSPNDTVLISLGAMHLRADGRGRCSFSDAPPDRACEFLLLPGSEVLRRSDAMVAIAEDGSLETFHPTLDFPEISEHAEGLVARGKIGRALDIVFQTVHANCLSPRFKGRTLFIRDLDGVLQRISDGLCAGVTLPPAAADLSLIIASEIYVAGGHSRIVEDLADTSPRSMILLTDCFRNVEAGRLDLSHFRQRLPRTPIVRLGGASLLDKTTDLIRFVAEKNPSTIYVLSHHQDPVPYAALASRRMARRKVFVHHTDHNPALGATLGSFAHLDCTPHLASVCSCVLKAEARHLPLSVDDGGVSPSTLSRPAGLSTVTAGNAIKFARSGHCAYPDIVATLLSSVDGRHHHIGHLDAGWIAEIHDRLRRGGIDHTRFVHHGVVPSLWDRLKTLDAQVYLASAPTPGTRAAIEAQGAGLPTLFYRDASVEPLLRMQEMYASPDLGWSALTDLPERLSRLRLDYRSYAQAARDHYERNYSRRAFEAVVTGI